MTDPGTAFPSPASPRPAFAVPGLSLTRPAPGVAQLTLDRPKTRNAVTAAMWAGIPFLLQDLEARVLLVAGAGGHFSSGADVSEFTELYATPEDAGETSQAIADATTALSLFPAPTLAVVRGTCMGGGAALALACDLVFGDTTAKWAFPPARLGLAYPYQDVRRLSARVGASVAKDLLFSARQVGAEEAARLGLSDRLLPPGDLENEVMDYADSLRRLSGESQRATKAQFARLAEGQSVDDAATRALFQERFTSADFQEGLSAFRERRTPKF